MVCVFQFHLVLWTSTRRAQGRQSPSRNRPLTLDNSVPHLLFARQAYRSPLTACLLLLSHHNMQKVQKGLSKRVAAARIYLDVSMATRACTWRSPNSELSLGGVSSPPHPSTSWTLAHAYRPALTLHRSKKRRETVTRLNPLLAPCCVSPLRVRSHPCSPACTKFLYILSPSSPWRSSSGNRIWLAAVSKR
ncbi:hypothetical protein L211DRAFT_721483 [Terfezia boudieri ATCC MYA-4762]|uniref:Uncharacterized protein n=1 Tax=Terfezia boudieri ATCC MYA-4762 TaxID=1051890 RepID=A0A3N4L9Z1_9PEZI|nr:hypothetical protein L211DRAFT_721483 [Terfezia boudieri ATCC MYA-4762]